MKKCQLIASILIGILGISLLTACQTKGDDNISINYLSDPKFDTEDTLPQYDLNKSWSHRLGDQCSCITEDTLYFARNDGIHTYIFYCDLATGISGPLCGKPECPHNDYSCSACVSQAFGLSVYDGRLYWLDLGEGLIPTIDCMELDGTNRTAICSLDKSQYQRISGDFCVAFHRGYAYISGQTYTVSGGLPHYGILAYAISLATGEETVILEQTYGEEMAPSIEVIPYRNTVYLISLIAPPSMEYTDENQFCISTWSPKTHEIVSLYTQVPDFSLRETWPTEDRLLFSATYGEIYQFDLASKELSLLFDLSAEGGNYRTAYFANDCLVDWTLTEDRIPLIHVTDLEGNVVYSETLDLPYWPEQGRGYTMLGTDNGNIYLALTTLTTDSIAQIPLDGGGSVREMWSREVK